MGEPKNRKYRTLLSKRQGMGKISQSSIIDQINEIIDPQQLLEKINYAPDKIQIIGTTLKCFCPLHKEKAFRSLIVDLKKKTFRCSVKGCKGFEGGTLVDFYAIHTAQPELKAAFSVAKLLNLQIDTELIEKLSQSFLDEAQQAFLERGIEKAQSFAAQALDVDPNNLEARFLLAQVFDEMGNHVGSIKEFQSTADGYAAIDDYPRAVEIYELYILKKEPKNEEILRKLASFYEKTTNPRRAIEIYLTIAGENEARNQTENNAAFYQKILELDPSRDDVRQSLAQLFEILGSLALAVTQYLALASSQKEKGDISNALAHLEHIKKIVPENFTSRELIAEIYYELGEDEKVEREYLELGEVAIEQDELETAGKYYQILLKKYPMSLLGREGLINFFEKMENRTALSRECLMLAELLESLGDLDRASESLARAKYHNPKDVSLREKLIHLLIKAERKEEAAGEYFQVADLYHELGDPASVENSLKGVKSIFPDNLKIQIQVCLKYHEYGNTEKAKSEFIAMADDFQDEEDYESGILVSREGLKIDEDDIPLNEHLLTALLQIGRKEEALEVYKHIYEIYRKQENLEKAEESLRDTLTIDEKNIYVHNELVSIYLSHNNISNALSTLISLSQIYYETGAIDEGIETATKILDLSPDAVATRERLAYLYREKQVYDQAIEEYNKAVEYYINLQQYSAAINDLKAILEIDENNQEALKAISDLFLKHESFESALPFLRKALDLLKSGLGSTDDVVAEYRRILQLKEDQLTLHEEFAGYLKAVAYHEDALREIRYLADVYKEKGDYAKTAGLLEDILSLHPDNNRIKAELADMYANLEIPQEALNYYAQAGAGYREQGDNIETIKIYRKILQIDPQEESIREELAQMLLLMASDTAFLSTMPKKYNPLQEAMEHYLFLSYKRSQEGRESENLPLYIKILELNPDQRDIREKLAGVYELTEDKAAAVDQLLILADSYEAEKDFQTAIGRCQKARDLAPTNDLPRQHLLKLYKAVGDQTSLKKEHIAIGEIFLDREKPDDAEVHFKKAQKLDPADISIGEQLARLLEARHDLESACHEYQKLGKLYEDRGDLDRAIATLRRVKALQPENKESYETIARLLVKNKNIPDALKEYYDLAVMCFESRNPEEALSYLNKISHIAPDNFEMQMASIRLLFKNHRREEGIRDLVSLSNALLQAGKLDEAIEAANLGLEEEQENLDLRECKIKALLGNNAVKHALEEYQSAADIAFSKQEYQRAENYLNAILERKPKSLEALQQSVECALKLGKTDVAMKYLVTLIPLYEKKEDLAKAIEACHRVLDLDPDHVEVMKQLSRIHLTLSEEKQAVGMFDRIADYYIQHGNYAEACTYLSRILEYDTESIQTIRKLAYLIYENENLSKARPHLKKLLDLCQTHYEPEEAVKEFEKVLKIDPQNPHFHLDYARFLRELADFEIAHTHYLEAANILLEDKRTRTQAIDVLAELLQLAPENTDLLVRIATICLQENRTEDAYHYYDRCASIFLDHDQLNDAIDHYLAALKIKPEESSLILRLGDLYEQSGRKSEAIQKYLELAELYIKQNQAENNIHIYKKILSLDDTMKPVRQKLARLFEKKKKIDDAIFHYLHLGRQYEEENERNQALVVYQHIKAVFPEVEENRSRMVELFLSSNRIDQAKRELEELADLSLSKKHLEDAEGYLLRVKEISPKDITVHEKLAQLYEQKGEIEAAAEEYTGVASIYAEQENFEKAIAILSRIKELLPDNPRVREQLFTFYKQSQKQNECVQEGLDLASLYFSIQKDEDALRVCKALSTYNPLDVNTRLNVAGIFQQHSLQEKALEEYVLLAGQLNHAKRYPEAIQICDTGLKLSSEHIPLLQTKIEAFEGTRNPQGAADLYIVLADIHKLRKNHSGQEEAYRKAIDIVPGHISAQEGLINLLTNLGRTREAVNQLLVLSGIHKSNNNPAGAVQCHQDILMMQPENRNVRDGLASLYITQGNIPAAIQEYSTLARLCEEDDQFSEARNYYGEILKLEDQNVDAIRSIVNLARKLNDHEGFIQYSLKLAGYFEGLQAFADALTYYKGIVEIDKSYLPAYQKLGYCYEAVGRIDEAVQTYKTLGMQYQKQGAYNAAIQQLEIVEKHHPNDWDNFKTLADLYLKIQNPVQAIHYYTLAIEIVRLQLNLEEAILLTRKLIDVAPDQPQSYRIYAELLENTEQEKDAAQNYSHLAGLLDSQGNIEDAAQARASVLRLDPEMVQEREKYASNLRQLGRQKEALYQYLELIEEYIRKKEFDKAVSSAHNVFALDKDNPEAHQKLKYLFVAMHKTPEALMEIDWLATYHIQTELYQEAEELLLEGLQLDPQHLPIREQLSLLYQKTDQLGKATEQLLKITEQSLVKGDIEKAITSLEQAKILAGENVEIRKKLADLYYRNNQPEKAREELFSAAQLYMEQGLVDKANRICEDMIQEAPKDCDLRELIGDLFREQDIPELAARQYLEVSSLKKAEGLYQEVIKFADKTLEMNPKSTEAHENRVESLLKLDRRPDAYEEFLTLSDLYSDLGLFDKARDAYRVMMELAPDDPLPLQKLVVIYSLTNNKDEQINTLRGLAEIYLKQDRTEEAVQTYRSIIDIRPDDTRARIRYIDLYSRIGPEQELIGDYVKLIDIFIKRGALTEATRIFERLVRITPDDPDIKEKFIRFLLQNKDMSRAFMEMLSLASIFVTNGELKKASKLLGEAAKIAPEDPHVHLQLAETYILMNARGMAAQELKKAATLFEATENVDKSLEIYQRIIDIDPHNLEICQAYIDRLRKARRIDDIVIQSTKLADLYIERGLLDLAENVYRDILKIQPDNIQIWNFLIQTHLQIGLEEDLVDDYLSLGDLYLSKDNLKEALEQYKKVIESDPLNVEVRRKYIDTYLQIGLEHDLIEEYIELADALMQKEEIEEAIRLYSHVMSLDPENKQARLKLSETQGRYIRKTPEDEDIDKIPEKPKTSEPPAPQTQKEQEPLLDESSYQEAIENYKNVLSVNPSNANIRCKLAEMYMKRGQKKDAIEEWDKASETFIIKGELDKGVSLCEKILELKPKDAKIRDRLSKAILQQDSFKAIESAISAYTDSYEKQNPDDTSSQGNSSQV